MASIKQHIVYNSALAGEHAAIAQQHADYHRRRDALLQQLCELNTTIASTAKQLANLGIVSQSTHISALPSDVLPIIFRHLPFDSHAAYAATCKAFFYIRMQQARHIKINASPFWHITTYYRWMTSMLQPKYSPKCRVTIRDDLPANHCLDQKDRIKFYNHIIQRGGCHDITLQSSLAVNQHKLSNVTKCVYGNYQSRDLLDVDPISVTTIVGLYYHDYRDLFCQGDVAKFAFPNLQHLFVLFYIADSIKPLPPATIVRDAPTHLVVNLNTIVMFMYFNIHFPNTTFIVARGPTTWSSSYYLYTNPFAEILMAGLLDIMDYYSRFSIYQQLIYPKLRIAHNVPGMSPYMLLHVNQFTVIGERNDFIEPIAMTQDMINLLRAADPKLSTQLKIVKNIGANTSINSKLIALYQNIATQNGQPIESAHIATMCEYCSQQLTACQCAATE